jgi:hypothetical protein
VTTDAESILECSTQVEKAIGDWQGCTESQLYLSEKVAAQEKEIIEAALRERQGRVFGPLGAAARLTESWKSGLNPSLETLG